MLKLRSLSLVVAFAAGVAFAAPAVADDVFAVTGSEPGSTTDSYTGKATVAQTGDTWTITWNIKGDQAVKGTAVIMDGYLAATGLYEGKPFVFLLKKDGAKYTGVWTVAGQTKFGRETWIPQ